MTVYPEIAGCFIPEEGEMAGELMCEENVLITTIRDSDDGVPFEEDAEFLRNIGEEVGRDLGQISVLVTEDRTEVEFVSGQFREELPDHMVDPESVFQSLL